MSVVQGGTAEVNSGTESRYQQQGSVVDPKMKQEVTQLLDVLCHNPRVRVALERMGAFVIDHNEYRAQSTETHIHPGYKAPFATANDWLNYVHPDDKARVEQVWQSVMDGRTDLFNCQFRFRKADGSYRWLTNQGTVVYRLDGGQPWIYLGSDTDVTELKEIEAELRASQQKLEASLLMDAQLGIPNRRFLQQQSPRFFDLAQRHQQQVAVMVCDIDEFKNLNDHLGHLRADELLLAAAQTLQSTLRSSDIIARFGGDEFVVVLLNTTPESVAQVADRMIERIEAIPIAEGDQKLSVSIGACCHIPQDQGDFWRFFEQADQALYRAKSSGRGRYVASS